MLPRLRTPPDKHTNTNTGAAEHFAQYVSPSSFQLWPLLSGRRVVVASVSDVYGSRCVHRLTLQLDRHGATTSISCEPCGLLHDVTYDQTLLDDEQTTLCDTRESQYSKVRAA